MMVRKICTTLAAVGLCLSAQASFNPSLSLLTNYTAARNNTLARSGEFDIRNRKVNFGIEFTDKLYLHNDFFIKTGIRISSFKTTITGSNKASSASEPMHRMTWSRSFTSFTIPVHFGKEIIIANGHRGDLSVGGSIGLLAFDPNTGRTQGYPASNGDEIMTWSAVSRADKPSYIFPTVDFGASYQPFKSKPEFSVGFLCSFQLNKTEKTNYQGELVNFTRGYQYAYDVQHNQRVTNYALVLSYRFGKPRALPQKSCKLDCPE